MAGNEVRIVVTGDSKDFEKAMDRAKARLDDFSKQTRRIGIGLAAVGAAGVFMLGKAFKGAVEEQQAIKLLDQALRNVGTSYKLQEQAIEKVIAAQERKTNFGDDEQRAALQRLIALSGDYQKSLDTLPATLDLAAGLEIDLATASNLMGRALAGNTELLTRYGLKLREGATAAELNAEITRKLGGSAEAAANPLTQLGNTISNLQDAFGKALLPAILPVIKALKNFTVFLNEHPRITQIAAPIAAVGTAFLVVNGALLLLLATIPAVMAAGVALQVSIGPLLLAVLGIEVAIVAVIAAGYLLVKNWDWIKEHLEAFVAIVATVGATIFGPITLAIGAVIVAGLLLSDHWDEISAAAKTVWNGVKDFFVGLWDGIKSTFARAVDNILETRDRIVEGFKAIARMIGDPLAGVWNAIKGGVDNVIGLINGALSRLNSAIEAYNKIPILPDIPTIPQIPTGGGGLGLGGLSDIYARGISGIKEFAKGGTVPGPMGQAQLALVHGGEEVLTPQQRSSRGTTVNITFDHVSVSEARRQIAQVVRDIVADGGLGDVGLARS